MRGLPLSLRRPADVGPFAVLLTTLAGTLLISPFLDPQAFGVPRFRLLVLSVLLAGMYALSHRRRALWLGLAIAIPAFAAEVGVELRPAPGLVLASAVLTIAFLTFLGGAMLLTILDTARVQLDTILGGIGVYLLLGLVWSLAYSLLEYLAPGSFQIDGQRLPGSDRLDEYRHEELIYYSFVTLTTVGYGDVLARTNPARALAAAEAVTGSLYLAIFIARLVGLHMVHGRRETDR
jgi:hypothetical protein